MIPLPTGVRVWLATGHTDLRTGLASLALLLQVLKRDPPAGHPFFFRGSRGVLLKVALPAAQGAAPCSPRPGARRLARPPAARAAHHQGKLGVGRGAWPASGSGGGGATGAVRWAVICGASGGGAAIC